MAKTLRVHLKGDKIAADKLRQRELVRLLRSFDELTAFNDLEKNSQRVDYDDGSKILIQYEHGETVVTITSPEKPVGKDKETGKKRTSRTAYYPALQVVNATREPYTRDEIPWGHHDPWLQPTKMGLLVSLTEGSFGGPYKFIPIETPSNISARYYYSFTYDSMVWENGVIPPFRYDQWCRGYPSQSDPPADLYDYPDRIPVYKEGGTTYSVVYDLRAANTAGSMTWGEGSGSYSNTAWTGGGSLADDAKDEDKPDRQGKVWHEAIWWAQDRKMLFRVMRSKNVDEGHRQDWCPYYYTSEEAFWPGGSEDPLPASATAWANDYLRGQADVSFGLAYYGIAFPDYDRCYEALKEIAANDGAYLVMNNPEDYDYLNQPNMTPLVYYDWHNHRSYDWTGDYLEECNGQFYRDEGGRVARQAFCCGGYRYPPGFYKKEEGPYEEANKNLYWTNKPYYPSELKTTSNAYDSPSRHVLYINGREVSLPSYVSDRYLAEGLLYCLGCTNFRYYNCGEKEYVIAIIQEYPSSHTDEGNSKEHSFYYYVATQDVESGDLDVSIGPVFTIDSPGVCGHNYYGPETYYDLHRHHIPSAMKAALPDGYTDCYWCVGEYRLIEAVTEESSEYEE